LGTFALFPHLSCPNNDLDRCAFPKNSRKQRYDNKTLVSTPGYFALTLAKSRIAVDMTASHKTSLFRFKFPTNSSASPLILMDLTDLSNSRQDNATITVDAKTGRMKGSAVFRASFGTGSYTAYFCADFRGGTIRDTGIFVDSRASAAVHELTVSRSINGSPLPGGAFLRFRSPGDKPILARVGVSLISSNQACSSAEAEIPSFDFEATKTAAEDAWRKKISPVVVSKNKVNSSLLVNFYSGIYRTMVNPQDYTNDNPLWQSSEPYFDSFYWLVIFIPFRIFLTIW
jgi:putative alpha-1,2-mannosidase